MSNLLGELRKLSEELATEIEAPFPLSGTMVQVRVDRGRKLPVFLARTLPAGSLAVSIGPVPVSSITTFLNPSTLLGVRAKVDYLDSPNESSARLVFELLDECSEDVFLILVAQISEVVESSQSQEQAVVTVLNLIERWKRFFSTSPDTALSASRRLGLFGELDFLNRLIAHGISPLKAVIAWVGPNRANQDFEFGSIAFEVKATSSLAANEFTVSNVRQLDSVGLERLYVFHLIVDKRAGAGRSLFDQVENLRQLFVSHGGSCQLIFERKLLEYGYLPQHQDSYRSVGYSERATDVYRITEGFPALTERVLPNGVLDASYRVSLTGCEQFIVDIAEEMGYLEAR